MAFPTVESITETAFASDATAHDVDMPATVNAGDLLLCFSRGWRLPQARRSLLRARLRFTASPDGAALSKSMCGFLARPLAGLLLRLSLRLSVCLGGQLTIP